MKATRLKYLSCTLLAVAAYLLFPPDAKAEPPRAPRPPQAPSAESLLALAGRSGPATNREVCDCSGPGDCVCGPSCVCPNCGSNRRGLWSVSLSSSRDGPTTDMSLPPFSNRPPSLATEYDRAWTRACREEKDMVVCVGFCRPDLKALAGAVTCCVDSSGPFADTLPGTVVVAKVYHDSSGRVKFNRHDLPGNASVASVRATLAPKTMGLAPAQDCTNCLPATAQSAQAWYPQPYVQSMPSNFGWFGGGGSFGGGRFFGGGGGSCRGGS